MKTTHRNLSEITGLYIFASLFFISFSAACEDRSSDPTPPNFLFIFSDDQRFDALGIAGHPVLQTPEIDTLAREGVIFSQAYCQSPMCAPSRMTVLTGLTQRSHGGNIRPFMFDDEMGLDDYTIIIFTSDNGYFMEDRGLAGKWSHYNESVRIPMIIYDPRLSGKKRGAVTDIPAMLTDIAPTILDFASLDIPMVYQGISLRQTVEDPPSATFRDALYLEHHLMNPDIPKWTGVRTAHYVYANYYENDHEFLHDLEHDPDQLQNLAKDPGYAAILEQMRNRLLKFHQQYPEYIH